MADDSYFRFGDDDKMKYKYSQNYQKSNGKLKIRSPIYCHDVYGFVPLD